MAGIAAARPWHEAAGATFTTVVDPENELGQRFDYKLIPNGLMVDEQGILRAIWIGGFAVERPECLELVDRFRTGQLKEPFVKVKSPGQFAAPAARSTLEQELYETRVRLGAELKAAGKTAAAVAEWQQALRMDPDNFVLRKQIWALQHPERFYPTIDWDWQQEQLAREKAEEAACGPEGCEIPPHRG